LRQGDHELKTSLNIHGDPISKGQEQKKLRKIKINRSPPIAPEPVNVTSHGRCDYIKDLAMGRL
jgi:hypothetical protein